MDREEERRCEIGKGAGLRTVDSCALFQVHTSDGSELRISAVKSCTKTSVANTFHFLQPLNSNPFNTRDPYTRRKALVVLGSGGEGGGGDYGE